MDTFFIGLVLISTVGGVILTFLWHWLLLWIEGNGIKEKICTREFLITGVLTGIVERFVFTLIVGLSGVGGAAAGAVGWVALKGQLHYHIFTHDPDNSDVVSAYIGILGSMVSLVIAFIGGVFMSVDYTWVSSLRCGENLNEIYKLLHSK